MIHSPLQILGSSGIDGSSGTTVTAGTANTKGSWIDFGAVAFPANTFCLLVDNTSPAVASFLFDVGVGVAGSQQIIASNIFFIFLTYGTFPLYFKSSMIDPGTHLWVRCQSTVASSSQRVAVSYSAGGRPFSPLTTLGAVASSTAGTSFTMGADVYGTWVSLGTLNSPGSRLQYIAQRDPSSLNTINIGVGPSSPPSILVANLPVIYEMAMILLEDIYCPSGQYWIQGEGTETYASQAVIYIQ